MVAVTGVSGAGKSSLINATLHPALNRMLHRSMDRVGPYDELTGLGQVDKAIVIDQQPIGRTPRSNAATYTKAFDLIREMYAQVPQARTYGYQAGRFSFNVSAKQGGGRCEACEGAGVREVEMHFLPNVFVTCEVCKGRRYNDATLRVKYKDKDIAQILDTPIDEAYEMFKHHKQLGRIMQTMIDVGLGYMSLGQPATTLSGGEAQRVKLARELARVQTGPHAVPARRADDGPPLRRRQEAARGAEPARRQRQHGARDRAQPRRHQDGRLDHRPRSRRRRGGRRNHRGRHARSRSRRSRAATRASSSSRCSSARANSAARRSSGGGGRQSRRERRLEASP